MDKRTLGTNGPEVSAIGLGCMSMTGGYSDKPDREEMISLIRAAVDRGVTFFDTAEIYGPYANEELVGEALAPYQGQVVIATKFGWDIDPVERKPRGRVTSRPDVIKHVVDGSLHRLGVDAIDLYQVHWPNPVVPNAPTMEGMRRVIDEGIVRHAGVSNFSLARWEDAERALGRPVMSNQVQYSLVQRKPERELLPYTQRAGRLVIAYSPLAQGLLSGHYDGTNPPRG